MRIITTVVADGIIGKYNIPWKILRLYDSKNQNECYDLLVDDNIINSYQTILEALKGLINQFDE